MVNETIRKFGYPETLLTEYEHWLLLLRPAQVTAGSLVLAAKGDFTNFGDLPAQAFNEQKQVISDVEEMLRKAINYEKVNYLMLMMVDPNVHFHVIPRYNGDRSLSGLSIMDAGWPGPPDLKSAVPLDSERIANAITELRDAMGK